VKGESRPGRAILGKPTDQDVNWAGQRLKRGVKLWPIGTDTAKAEIYGRLQTAAPGPGYVHLSRNMPAEIFEQLTSERLVTRYVKGRARLEWVKPAGKRNEALDCAVYALAGAHYVGIDRWREGDWAKWESLVQSRDLFELLAPTPAPAPAFTSAQADEIPTSEPESVPIPELPDPLQRALEYVGNTARRATLANFLEDHSPIGEKLWSELLSRALAHIDESGHIVPGRAPAAVGQSHKARAPASNRPGPARGFSREW
jgi:hypothetical protein